MKTIGPIALSVTLALVACGHEEPSKTAANEPPPPAAQVQNQQPTAVNEPTTTAPANAANDPTTADVPHEGPNAGNPVAIENGAAEAQADAAMTDAQILQIVRTANVGEVDQAKLALTRSKNTAVRDLAKAMVRDHQQSESKGAVVAKKDGLTLEPTAKSETLESNADDTTRTLRTEAAAEFDKDYVGAQVREHMALLEKLDQKLIPHAQSADVRAYLVETRAAVASHLAHAENVQNELQK